MTTHQKLLRLSEVVERIGFKKSSIYLWISEGKFPQPLKLGQSTRWVASEVESWLEKKIAEAPRKAA